MDILLSFTGFHDPFGASAIGTGSRAGPLLTVVNEMDFDMVYLFDTPKLGEKTIASREAILERHPDCKVEILEVPLKDPTNYLGILRQLRSHFKKLNRKHPDARYFISVSSGTPHMHASWLLLAASGEIPARILQAIPPEFVPEGKKAVKEIDFTQDHFPRIVKPIDIPDSGDDDELILAACRDLGIVGEDPAFTKALREAAIYANYDEHVLLLGETGSGKEYFAKFLHHLSNKAAKPLVIVNCGSIPENLVESHLFGHKKGAFTGAVSDHEGKFKTADGGVIFLDELGELPLNAQAKLLRTLEQGEIEPVGAPRASIVDVKVIAATNRDLNAMAEQGAFRADLLQRFGSKVKIPALRQRRIDIPKLAVHLLDRWNAKYKQQRRMSADAVATLADYHWPGNVRELRNVIAQSAMLSSGKVIRPRDLRFEDGVQVGRVALPEPGEGFELSAYLDEVKDGLIARALEKSGGVQARAAKLLGWTPQAVSQHLKQRINKRK